MNSNIKNKNWKNPFDQIDIIKVRNDYYQKKKDGMSEENNEFSSTSSVTGNKKENKEKNTKQNDTLIIENKNDEQKTSNYTQYNTPIDFIKNNDSNGNLDTKDNKEKSNNKKPTYYIPFKKIFKEDNKKTDIEELKYNDNANNNNNKKNNQNKKERKENIKFSNEILNSNSNYINPGLPGINKNESNLYNINYSNVLMEYLKIFEEEKKFNQLLKNGLISLSNYGNLNNYLWNMFLNNNFNNSMNNYNNFLNYNQFNPFNNNMNYIGNIYNNCFPNNHIINSIQHQKNINSFNNINNPENCTITLKSKTNDPSIEKIAKIQITTSFVKGNSKVKQENNDNQKSQNTKNAININDIINGKEKRTVVRLNPIPPNYSSFDVCKLLDMYLKIESGKNQRIYKALYTPLCKVIGKNLGYCFVMMVKPKYVIDFVNVFNGKIFGKKKCKKPCKVIWADIQGEEFLKTSEEDPIRKPIIFKDIIIDKDDK